MTIESLGKLASCAERGDVWHGLCARAPTLLLASADDEWREAEASSDLERADAFRGVKLVAGTREEVNHRVA